MPTKMISFLFFQLIHDFIGVKIRLKLSQNDAVVLEQFTSNNRGRAYRGDNQPNALKLA